MEVTQTKDIIRKYGTQKATAIQERSLADINQTLSGNRQYTCVALVNFKKVVYSALKNLEPSFLAGVSVFANALMDRNTPEEREGKLIIGFYAFFLTTTLTLLQPSSSLRSV